MENYVRSTHISFDETDGTIMDYDSVDLKAIRVNPYPANEAIPGLNQVSLREAVIWFSVFFSQEAQSDGDVYDAWNAYQARSGDAAMVRLAQSIEHTLGVVGVLEEIRSCRDGHIIDRLEPVPVLLHIGLLEQVEGGSPPGFPEWALGGISRGELDDSLAVGEFIERYKEQYLDAYGAIRSLLRALEKGTTEQERRDLLTGYAFTESYAPGKPRPREWHFHCKRREAENQAASKKSTLALPYEVADVCTRTCPEPSSDDVKQDFPNLVRRLYEMRSLIVHSASPVTPAASGASSAFLGRYDRRGKQIGYACFLDVADVIEIFRRALWRRISEQEPGP